MNAGTVKRNEFGFTNSQADVNACIAWREAAIADGWDHKATYEPTEGEDRACRLTKDGFVAQIITRQPVHLDPSRGNGKWKAEAQVNVWGPDGLALVPPNEYNFEKLSSGVRTCSTCGKQDVETTRVGFAGRCCLVCAPIEEAKLGRHYYD